MELGRVGIRVHYVRELASASSEAPWTFADHALLLVEEGHVDVEVDDKIVTALAGTVVLIQPGMRVSLSLRHERWRGVLVEFGLDAPEGVLPPVSAWPLARVMLDGDIVRPLVRHIESLAKTSFAGVDELMENAARQVLAVLLVEGSSQPQRRDALPPPVERALSYTRKLWTDQPLRSPSLDQLANAAGVSCGHLSRLFRESVGMAPLGALRRLRLDRAAAELIATSRSIKEIAHEAGFESQFHFSRCFKKAFGDSPSTYRERLSAELAPASRRRALPPTSWLAAG